MQYEYIGQVPNNNNYVKGKLYYINPKRDGEEIRCNIQEISQGITQQLTTEIYENVPAFRHDWKVVSAEMVQGRTEAAELVQ